MSLFSVFNASFAGLLLVGLFIWKVSLLWIVLFCVFASIFLYIFEISGLGSHYVSRFWLFIFREVIVFGRLILCCLYFDYEYYVSLSSPLELPFLGCFFLLGSSLTVTGYHHLLGWKWSNLLLVFTVILGMCFVCLQMVEMEEIGMNIFDTTFHARRFCTIGLHFSHVLLGVIGLISVLVFGMESLGFHRCSIIVWYWHFVDYVWLFVYTFVYVC